MNIIYHAGTGTYFDMNEAVIVDTDILNDPDNVTDEDAVMFGQPTNDVYVIVVGNPVDGYSFIGPFWGSISALEWATMNAHDQWSLVNLTDPNTLTNEEDN